MAEKSDCVFCKIIKGEIPSEKVLEGDNFIAIKDVYPKTEGHTLVIPKEHWTTLLDIPASYGEELLSFIKKVASKLIDDGFGNGFNVIMNNFGCAGQVVMHAHLHIIPRKEGDNVKSLSV